MFLSPYSPSRIKECYREVIVQQREDIITTAALLRGNNQSSSDDDENNNNSQRNGGMKPTTATIANSSNFTAAASKLQHNHLGNTSSTRTCMTVAATTQLATAFPDSFPLPRMLPGVSAVKFSWPGDSYQESDEAFRNFLKRMKPSWVQREVIAERKQKLKEREHRVSVLMGHSRPQGRSAVVQHLVTTNNKISDEVSQLYNKKRKVTKGLAHTTTTMTFHTNNNLASFSEQEGSRGHYVDEEEGVGAWGCEGCQDCWESEFMTVFLRPISALTGTGYWALRGAILQTTMSNNTAHHHHHPQCQLLLLNNNHNSKNEGDLTTTTTSPPPTEDDDNITDSSYTSTSIFSREVSATSIGHNNNNNISNVGGGCESGINMSSSGFDGGGGTFFPSHHWSAGDFMTTLHVDLEWQYVSETTMKWLRKLPQIRELFLVSVHMTTLDNIELGCPQLEVLSLKRCPCLSDLDGLGKCTNLRDVHIDDCVKLSNVDGLLGCAEFSLETLVIKACPQLRDISGLDVSGARMLQEQSHYDKMLEAYKLQKSAWERKRLEYFAKRQQFQRKRQQQQQSIMPPNGSSGRTSISSPVVEASNGSNINIPTLNLGGTATTNTEPTPSSSAVTALKEVLVQHNLFNTTPYQPYQNDDAELMTSRGAVVGVRPSRPGTSSGGGGARVMERVTAQSRGGGAPSGDDDDDVFAPWAASSALPTFRNHFNNDDPTLDNHHLVPLYTSRSHTNNNNNTKSSRPTSGYSQSPQGGGGYTSRRRSSVASSFGGGYNTNRYGLSSSMTSTSAFPSFRFEHPQQHHRNGGGRSMSTGSAVPFYAMPGAGGGLSTSSSSFFIKRTWKNDPDVEGGVKRPAPHPLRRLQRRRSSQHVMYIPAAVNHPQEGNGDSDDDSWDHDSYSSHGSSSSISSRSSSSDDHNHHAARSGQQNSKRRRRKHNKKGEGQKMNSSSVYEFDVYAVPKQFRPLRKLVLQDCPFLHDVIALRSCVHLAELVLWGCPLVESLRWLQGRKVCEEEDRARIHETTIFRKFMTQNNNNSHDVPSSQQSTSKQFNHPSSRSISPSQSSEFHQPQSPHQQQQMNSNGRLQQLPPIGSPPTSGDEDIRSMSGSPTAGLLKQRRQQQQHQRQQSSEGGGELGGGVDEQTGGNERSLRSIRTVAVPTQNRGNGGGDKNKSSSYLTTDEVISLLNKKPTFPNDNNNGGTSISVSSSVKVGEEVEESSALKELAQIIKAQYIPSTLPTPAGSLKMLVLHDCRSLYDLEVVCKCDGVESISISGSTPIIQPPRIPLLYFQQLGLGAEAAAAASTAGGGAAGSGVVSITASSTMSVGSHVSYVGNGNNGGSGGATLGNNSSSSSPVSKSKSIANENSTASAQQQQSPSIGGGGKLLPPLSPTTSKSPTSIITSTTPPSNNTIPLSSTLSTVEIFPHEWLYTDTQHQQQQQLFNDHDGGREGDAAASRENALLLECMQELRTRIGSSATGPASTRQAFTSLKNIIQGCYTSYSQRQIEGGFLQVKCQECAMVDAAGGDIHKLAALRKRRQDLLELSSQSTATNTLKLSDNDQLRSLDGISGNFAGNLQVVEIKNCTELENIHGGLDSRCDRCIERHDIENAPTIVDGKIVVNTNKNKTSVSSSSSSHPQWLSQSPYLGNITTLSICGCPQLTSLGDLIQQNGKTLRVLTLQFLGSLQTATFNEQLGYCCCLEEVVLCGIPNIQAIEGLSSSRNTLRELALCALPWFSNANFVNLLQCRNQGNNPLALQNHQASEDYDNSNTTLDNTNNNGSSTSTTAKHAVSGSIAHRRLLTQYPALTLVIFADCPAISLSQAITDSKRLIPFSQVQSISLN